MENGHIKEMGNHAELLEKSGYYRRLYDLQFNRNPEEAGAEVELLAGATV
jgi:ABC-type transport system involved in cytochrome bd biosynthesis fused ATPase/permease subunit